MSYPQNGSVVRIHYTGKLEDGTIFDSSRDREPLEFTVGAGQVIVGFEDAVLGLTVGEKTTAYIPAEKAYGPRRDDMTFTVSRKEFPADIDPKVGMKFQVPTQQGFPINVTLSEVTDESLTMDANHELAGKDLIFDIELVELR